MSEETPKRVGRPPLPEGEARTDSLRTQVRPRTGKAFRDLCKARGISVSDALQEAALDWVRKNAR